ncbi:acyl-CoA thioesterase [Paenibacillus sp. 1001270B_150601_E10]|uniref:acyl-CoA thioesterase n=1 Tax=Paenibacillus sp. 1001270B_150601_E10 TaxID=2787079 RepID=UPI00189F40E0|nr:thioesterase family protein [Paenibacillus sp. 1001270B_150601_E10]
MQNSSTSPSLHNPWYGHHLRVRYQETDRMGVVFHGNYVTWFEVGRTEWIRALGISYKQLEEQGLLLPVVDLNIRYQHPARYDDEVIVFTRLKKLSPIRMTFQSMVTQVSEEERKAAFASSWVAEPIGSTLVEGETTLAWVGSDWKPKRFDRERPDIWGQLKQVSSS